MEKDFIEKLQGSDMTSEQQKQKIDEYMAEIRKQLEAGNDFIFLAANPVKVMELPIGAMVNVEACFLAAITHECLLSDAAERVFTQEPQLLQILLKNLLC